MKNYEIGSNAYPVDNSWSYTVGTNECPYLAGMNGEYPKKVLIVSKPYYIKVSSILKPHSYKFVTVMYNRKCHVILNNFRNVPFKI